MPVSWLRRRPRQRASIHCRVDRRSLGEAWDLPVRTLERLLWTAPREAVAQDSHLDLVRSLTDGQWALLVIEAVQTQVDNGGFDQFLYNEGEYLQDAAAAARLVEANDYVPLFEEASALFPEGLPRGLGERGEFLDRLREDEEETAPLHRMLHTFDDRFYAIDGGINALAEHALRYAEQHPEDFFLSEEEAERDVDDFIARLRERVGPCRVASAAEVEAAEMEFGRKLPPLAARLYREVGDGGWGPHDGFLSLLSGGEMSVVGWLRRLRRDVRGSEPGQVWPDGALPISSADEIVICLLADTPELEVRRFSLAKAVTWYSLPGDQPEPSMPYEAYSLRGWLEGWLAA